MLVLYLPTEQMTPVYKEFDWIILKSFALALYFTSQTASRWPRGLRRASGGARSLGLRVRILPMEWTSVASFLCCKVEVSASG